MIRCLLFFVVEYIASAESVIARIELEMAGTSVDEKWSIDKIDSSNWNTWKFQMCHLLLAKRLWGHVDGTDTLAENTNAQTLSFSKNLREPFPQLY